MQPSKSPALTFVKDEKATLSAYSRWVPLKTMLKAQALLLDGAPVATICAELDIPEPVFVEVIQRFGWDQLVPVDRTPEDTKRRAELVSAKLIQWNDQVKLKSAALALGGMELAERAVEAGDTRSFSDAAKGANAFAQLARQAAGMDSKDATGPQGSTSINFFVARIGENGVAEKPAINITPAQPETIQAESDFAF